MATVSETQMLMRRSVNIVFNAFVDPLITTKFWFSQSSGYLEKGAMVDWTWDKYQITHSTHVLQVVENELICIEWGTPKTKVDFIYLVYIENENNLNNLSFSQRILLSRLVFRNKTKEKTFNNIPVEQIATPIVLEVNNV